MFRRSKVILVKGTTEPPLSEQLTLAPLQRLNVDYFLIAFFLQNSHYMPADFREGDLLTPRFHVFLSVLLDHLQAIEETFSALAAYASIVADRRDIRVVEGDSLAREWVYNHIRFIHKSLGQRLTEVDIMSIFNHMIIDGQTVPLKQGVEMITMPLQPD